MIFTRKVRFFVFLLLMFAGMVLTFQSSLQPHVYAQQPTGSVPTVTGTPQGVIVALYLDRPQEDVYSGPSSYLYPRIGVLLAGQEMPAYGISEDESWVQIYYPGVPDSVAWVYAAYVKIVKTGQLPKLDTPPHQPQPQRQLLILTQPWWRHLLRRSSPPVCQLLRLPRR